jgi:tetratricopeptide (TPR) repeat protein
MFKILIILTGISTLFVMVVNLDLFDNNIAINRDIPIKKESIPNQAIHPKPTPPIPKKLSSSKDSLKHYSLLDKMNSLLKHANIAKSHSKFQKSLELYDKIIETLQEHHEFELEKIYALAQFYRAMLLEFNLKNRYQAIQGYKRVAQRYEKSQQIIFLNYYAKAQFYRARMVEQDQSIEIYDEIIDRFKHSSNIELLKHFAKASFEKSYLLTSYEAIDIYDEIITKFSKTDKKELLEELYDALMNKAYILENYLEEQDETIEVYDQIIEKFSSYSDKESQAKVENTLFSKAFLLMGESDEEAIELFDNIIEFYQKKERDTKTIPKNFIYALVNNIELSLITNNDDSRYQELAEQYLQNSKESIAEIEMLQILKNAQEIDQSEAIAKWEKDHKDFQFENWSFAELERWNDKMEASESKTRIRSYLDQFIKHTKYQEENRE